MSRLHLSRLLPYLRRHGRGMGLGLVALLLTTVFSVMAPWVLRFAIDELLLEVTREKLLAWAGLIVSVVMAEGLFRFYTRRLMIGISREIEYELRRDLFARLLRLSPSWYDRNRVGDVMSRATSDMSAVRMVLGPGIMYTANTLATFTGAIALMIAISPSLALVAVVPLLVVSVLVRIFGRRIHDRFTEVQEQLSTMNSLVQESLSGVRVVRAYVQEPHEKQRFGAANDDYVERNRRLIRLFGSLYPGIQFLIGTGAVLVLYLGGRQVIAGTITLGEFVAFGAYLRMLHWPMIALGWVVNLFERGEASMRRLVELMDAPVEIDDRNARPGEPVRGAVSFRGLSFAYGDGPEVLKDVDLEVPAGTTVAVVGPTGSGKSTLVSLIPRLYEAPPGTLLVDGRDVREIRLEELRRAVGFVPQETFLFSETVGENVAFGASDADSERTRWAAGVAQLARDVEGFPRGYDTFVGERGITLSGGQKQRAAIARALVPDPEILILDDALASVDTYTEEEILKGLQGVMESRTTFLVSHRVSTVKNADLIVVLRQGRIAEMGRHDELVEAGGFYAELHRRQLLEDEVQTA